MKTQGDSILSVNLTDLNTEDLLKKEWLLTNRRGGFASGTLAGCNTRRYHGLLTGTPPPPPRRLQALAT
jgi:glycogen debranching enzyme